MRIGFPVYALWLACFMTLSSSVYSQQNDLADIRQKFNDSMMNADLDLAGKKANQIATYKKNLEALAGKYQKAGNLEGLLEIKKEQSRIDEAKEDIASDGISNADIKVLYESYLKSVAKDKENRNKTIVNIGKAYYTNLEDLKKALTKQNKIEEAMEVKKEQDNLPANDMLVAAGYGAAPETASKTKSPPSKETKEKDSGIPKISCYFCNKTGEMQATCSKCSGSGKCKTCSGNGTKTFGFKGSEKQITCTDCSGNGQCAACKGAGTTDQKIKCTYCKGTGKADANLPAIIAPKQLPPYTDNVWKIQNEGERWQAIKNNMLRAYFSTDKIDFARIKDIVNDLRSYANRAVDVEVSVKSADDGGLILNIGDDIPKDKGFGDRMQYFNGDVKTKAKLITSELGADKNYIVTLIGNGWGYGFVMNIRPANTVNPKQESTTTFKNKNAPSEPQEKHNSPPHRSHR